MYDCTQNGRNERMYGKGVMSMNVKIPQSYTGHFSDVVKDRNGKRCHVLTVPCSSNHVAILLEPRP